MDAADDPHERRRPARTRLLPRLNAVVWTASRETPAADDSRERRRPAYTLASPGESRRPRVRAWCSRGSSRSSVREGSPEAAASTGSCSAPVHRPHPSARLGCLAWRGTVATSEPPHRRLQAIGARWRLRRRDKRSVELHGKQQSRRSRSGSRPLPGESRSRRAQSGTPTVQAVFDNNLDTDAASEALPSEKPARSRRGWACTRSPVARQWRRRSAALLNHGSRFRNGAPGRLDLLGQRRLALALVSRPPLRFELLQLLLLLTERVPRRDAAISRWAWGEVAVASDSGGGNAGVAASMLNASVSSVVAIE